MTSHYDTTIYADAIAEFDEFLKQCTIIRKPKQTISELQVSTITCVCPMADSINLKSFFEEFDLYTHDDVAYIKPPNGSRKQKPNITVSNKQRKKKIKKHSKNVNQLFSNQSSIGFVCTDEKHVHKNPISVKMFRNGIIQMTGCKSCKEIQHIYNRVLSIICNHCIKAKKFHSSLVQIEMINATFYANCELNLHKVLKVVTNNYSHKEIFVIQNKTSPLNLSIKSLAYFDERKQKYKAPSVFVYNTGAINIIATGKQLLQDTYDLITGIINQFWNDIVQVQVVYPPSFSSSFSSAV